MFSFLQFIGFSFVILGMYLEFKYKAHDLGSENFLEILEKEAKLPIISDLDIMDVFEINSINHHRYLSYHIWLIYNRYVDISFIDYRL